MESNGSDNNTGSGQNQACSSGGGGNPPQGSGPRRGSIASRSTSRGGYRQMPPPPVPGSVHPSRNETIRADVDAEHVVRVKEIALEKATFFGERGEETQVRFYAPNSNHQINIYADSDVAGPGGKAFCGYPASVNLVMRKTRIEANTDLLQGFVAGFNPTTWSEFKGRAGVVSQREVKLVHHWESKPKKSSGTATAATDATDATASEVAVASAGTSTVPTTDGGTAPSVQETPEPQNKDNAARLAARRALREQSQQRHMREGSTNPVSNNTASAGSRDARQQRAGSVAAQRVIARSRARNGLNRILGPEKGLAQMRQVQPNTSAPAQQLTTGAPGGVSEDSEMSGVSHRTAPGVTTGGENPDASGAGATVSSSEDDDGASSEGQVSPAHSTRHYSIDWVITEGEGAEYKRLGQVHKSIEKD